MLVHPLLHMPTGPMFPERLESVGLPERISTPLAQLAEAAVATRAVGTEQSPVI
jgi:hypothetical protein